MFEGFADKTTVMAPRMASKIPKKSRLGDVLIVGFFRRSVHTLRNRSLSISGAKKQFAINANCDVLVSVNGYAIFE